MPGTNGIGGLGFLIFSTKTAWVVRTTPAIDAAFWSAHLETRQGSTTPEQRRSSYLPVITLYPVCQSQVLVFSITMSPSTPALAAIDLRGARSACNSTSVMLQQAERQMSESQGPKRESKRKMKNDV